MQEESFLETYRIKENMASRDTDLKIIRANETDDENGDGRDEHT